jgi:hypothetical protein
MGHFVHRQREQQDDEGDEDLREVYIQGTCISAFRLQSSESALSDPNLKSEI